jgi:hypothetical protein
VKAVNNLVGVDSIMLTLLVFRVYSRITKDSLLLPFIIKRAKAIYKTIKKVRRLYAEQQVNNALVIKNGLNTKLILILLL